MVPRFFRMKIFRAIRFGKLVDFRNYCGYHLFKRSGSAKKRRYKMDKVKQFRELTRELECHLENINRSDCCQCSVNESQCFLVVEIGRNPGICIKDLAKQLHLDKSGISRSIEELVQKDYVVREPSKTDRRCVVLTLTDAGQSRFEKIENDMNAAFKKVFSRMSKTEQEKVLEALKIYNEACRKDEECCTCSQT